jgi:hypothetical protein
MSAARHLRVTPSAAEVLRQEISDLCVQIDRRLHNRPGTAERGLYAWFWPPDPSTPLNVLTNLHADACKFLHTIVTAPKEKP